MRIHSVGTALLWELCRTSCVFAQTAAAPSAQEENVATDYSTDQVTTESEVVVLGTRRPVPGAEVGLSGSQASQVAGSQGDAAKVVQSLPGVARSGANAEPVAWGSAPRETGIFIDGVPLPQLFHGSGVRSLVPSALISTIRFTPGAYGVELGRYLGGALQLTTTDVLPSAPEVALSSDALDSAAMISLPVKSDSSVRIAARYGYLERWLPAVLGDEASQLYTFPSYKDAHVQRLFSLPNDSQLKVQLLTSSDDALRDELLLRHRSGRRTHRAYAVYEHAGVTSHTQVVPYLGLDTESEETRSFGSGSKAEQRVVAGGLRVDVTYAWQPLQLRAGLDARYAATSANKRGSLTIPPREGDSHVFGRPPGREYVVDEIRVNSAHAAPFVELDVPVGTVRFAPGVRLETTVTDVARAAPAVAHLPDTGATQFETAWLPRLGTEWTLSERVRWSLIASRHVQSPDVLDRGTLTGNPKLRMGEAVHLVLGNTTKVTTFLSVQVMAFRKWLRGLAVRSSDPTPAPGEVLNNQGQGDVWGMQSMLQLRQWRGYSGWLGLTISRSQRQDVNGWTRPFDYDQPFVATFVLNKALGLWNISGRLRGASGSPRPAVIDADYDLQQGRYDPVVDVQRYWRLPAFFSLDTRVEREIVSAAQRWFVYVEITNATNHTNVEEVTYNWDYSERRYLQGLPLLAFLGVRAVL